MNALRKFVDRTMFRYISKRYNLRDPVAWREAFVRGDDLDDFVVGPHTALMVPAVWACVRVRGEDTAKVPFKSYRKLSDGGRELIVGDPRYSMLHDSPNPETTAVVFWETMQRSMDTYGNAYAEIVRNVAGAARQLWYLRPDRMEIKREIGTGSLVYTKRDDGGNPTDLRPEQVFHVPGPTFDGVVGLNPLSYARQAITIASSGQHLGAKMLKNGLRPSGVLEHPGKLSDVAATRLRDSFEKLYGGSENAGKFMILWEGMKFNKMGMTMEDAQFVEMMQLQLPDIARIWRVPPHKIQDLTRSTNNNIEHQSIESVVDMIMPSCRRFEAEAKRKLFPESDLYAEFLLTGLLRGDMTAQKEFYSGMVSIGVYSPNRVLELLNENPYPGGDVHVMQGAMVPIDKLGAQNPTQVVTDNPDGATRTFGAPIDAFRPMIRETWRAILRVEKDKLSRAGRRGDATFRETFFAGQAAQIVRLFSPVVESLHEAGIEIGEAVRMVAAEHVAASCVGTEDDLTDAVVRAAKGVDDE